jgi:serine/threonine protein phosphatase 1
MLRQGIEQTLASYGSTIEQGRTATRDGAPTMTRWTNTLRANIRKHPGHEKFMTILRRAAFTAKEPFHGTLFVHSGIDPARPIGAQKDSFWWNHGGFNQLNDVYEGFARVVRGSDPSAGGLNIGKIAVTLDRGAGFGGTLVAGCFAPDGEVLELLEV